MRIAKGSRAVANARFEMAARAIADVISASPAPLYYFGRLLIRAADSLQSIPPSSSVRPVNSSSAAPSDVAPDARPHR
jgi:hypothetical protein